MATSESISHPQTETLDVPEWFKHCCADLSRVRTHESASGGRLVGMKAVVTNASRLWDNGQTHVPDLVHLICRSEDWDGNQQNKVKEVLKLWQEHVNLDFNFVEDNDTSAIIRISFDPNRGSYSYIAKDMFLASKTEQTMNLGWVWDNPAITDNEMGNILHEFGHAIGFLHEIKNPRRDEKLKLREKVIIDYYLQTQPGIFNEESVRYNILDVYNLQEVTNFSSLDLKSVMKFFMPAEWNEGNIEVLPNYVLSEFDKAFALLNYPFAPDGDKADDVNAKLEAAFATLNVQDDFKKSILAEITAHDWDGARAEFTRWCINETALADKAKPEVDD
ncbi:hypothetical protein EST38_g13669 [Candolleomyces aberdarensis]|uniref:Peptidase metallopeptidase domain-containing protein n=1 Tax=Candolleomyces aberdarensis TaxID=2316362 RepID=A0A4V1Q1N3_9AGAR|nr:hypothetical protein EST38_g13669 [Candolleomyces aberdarensis]